MAVALVAATTMLWGQQNAVVSETSGNRVYLEMSLPALQSNLDTLFARSSQASSLTWSDVLANGGSPGVDVAFNGFSASGIGDLAASGTVTADSLVLNKDAALLGRLNITGVTQLEDSLRVAGFVEFADSLRVLKAVAIGETLHVSGLTTLGDSLHVMANVDFDALFNVDGDATFGGTIHADSIVVADVINGRISSLSNLTSDELAEGEANLYFTAAERVALAQLMATVDSLIAVINGSGGAPETAFTCGNALAYQGYDYATVQIGEQCWFAENLQATSYRDDEAIASGLTDSEWTATSEGALVALNDDAANVAAKGLLYNGHAVNSDKLCPSGWHVPLDGEWVELTDFLDGSDVAGLKMKRVDPDWNGSNESGFSGVISGARTGAAAFILSTSHAYWWSSPATSLSSTDLNCRYAYTDAGLLAGNILPLSFGLSVRCLMDDGTNASVPSVTTTAETNVTESGVTFNGTVDGDGGDAVTATGFRWGQASDLNDASNLVGSATSGSFSAALAGLTAGTTYYFSAFAQNGAGTAFGDTLSFTTTAAAFSCGDPLNYQGYDYGSVEIGSQCWFAENLQSLLYNDDEAIPSDLDATAWSGDVLGAVAVYDGDENNAALYGRLYNWYAVETGKLCPAGWHVASDEDWKVLEIALGMSPSDADLSNSRGTDQGAQMKSSDTWGPNWNGTNSSGLSVVPGGYRSPAGVYTQVNVYGALWSSTSSGSGSWTRLLTMGVDDVYRGSNLIGHGFSVRCMMDELE